MFKEKYSAIYDRIEIDEQLLTSTLTQKRLTKKSTKPIGRFVALPVGAVALLFIVFTLLVNLSSTFALALNNIPTLNRLAEVVSFSPSLSDAVDNEYVQVIGQEKTIDDITIRIEYVIVDQRQLHVFYTLQSERYDNLWLSDFRLMNADNTPLDEYIAAHLIQNRNFMEYDFVQEDLRYVMFSFIDIDMPEDLIIEGNIFDAQESELISNETASSTFSNLYNPVPIQSFSIPISFDSKLIQQIEVIDVNQEFILDGQTVTITTIDILPTQTRVNFIENEGNSAWLKFLSLYIIDENGVRFGQAENDVTRVGFYGSDIMLFNLETLYFTDSQNLTLVITDAVWLDKNTEPTRVDLVNNVAENLPPDVDFIEAKGVDGDWFLTFSVLYREQKHNDYFFVDTGGLMHETFSSEFYDGSGNIQLFAIRWGTSNGYEVWKIYDEEDLGDCQFNASINPLQMRFIETPGAFGDMFTITDYSYDVVYLIPSFSHMSILEAPIEIIVQ